MSLNDQHFMLDIETYDIDPSAVILSIGAVSLVQNTDGNWKDYLYIETDIHTQYQRTVSTETRDWWATQSNCPNKGSIPLPEALSMLSAFLLDLHPKPIVWCKGLDFDIAILTHAYRQYNMSIPWKYNNVRDWRTLSKLFRASVDPTIHNTQPHNALEDATYQGQQLLSTGFKLK